MCGIGGVYLRDGAPVDAHALARMSEAMRERGPDDHGQYVSDGVGLVHRRLSIIDLSEAGRCPIANDDGSIQVVHNGEIYNFAALREELEASGHRFRSSCDSEVIVHGYAQWGTGVAERLHGMFAIAIWDASRRRLVLMRDRLGKKPLYVLRREGQVAFASTLGALHAWAAGQLDVDPSALECFLSHGFIPHPHTIWRGVTSLLPAHLAVVEGEGDLRAEPYWQLPDATRRAVSAEDALDEVEESLDRSVRSRLVADVLVGGFLSGGVDSSLVMALAARHSPRVDTFSIGFEGDDQSELPHARRVAEHIGSTHHELVLDVGVIDDLLPELVWQYGQPFGDSSSVPTHLVSRLARETVKVALSGDGGDESFAGYWRAESGRYADVFRRGLPEPVRRHAVPALAGALARLGGGGLAGRLDALNRLSLARPGAGYTNSESWLDRRGELLGPFFEDADPAHRVEDCRTGKPYPGADATVLQQILYDDFQVLLPDDYLVKVDVASMAASLEVRSPFLDHAFVELAWRLPDALKLRGRNRKWLLKRLAARHVPPEVVYRPKMGFAMPLQSWWRAGLLDVLETLLADSRAVERGFVRSEPIRRALGEHRAGNSDHATRLWLILWLEIWVRVVLEGSLDRAASLRALRGG